jgi:hypothetical protein
MKEFEKNLRDSFTKRKDLFTLSRARKATGSNTEQVKKYLSELVRRGKLRKADVYFFGCPPNELIVQDFGFGEVTICPICNSEVSWPPEDLRRYVCGNCETEYVKSGNGRWHMISGPKNWAALVWGRDNHAYDFLFWYEAINRKRVAQQFQDTLLLYPEEAESNIGKKANTLTYAGDYLTKPILLYPNS